MSETQALLSVLRGVADRDVTVAIATLIAEGKDHELNRVNVFDVARRTGLAVDKVLSGFLHAARLGLFDMSWNVLCPGCSGVLDAHASLKSLAHQDYHCALCAAGYEATLDELVEVTFTVNPRVRRIGAHQPGELPIWEYFRQVFWSSGLDLRDDSFASLIEEVTLDAIELPPGEKAVLSFTLPNEFIILFEPVTHAAQFLDIKGEPTRERQHHTMIFNRVQSPAGTLPFRPGPMRLTVENRTEVRTLPSVWVAGQALHDLLGHRKPFLTAKRVLTNQTFRDLFKADTLNVDQRLKITSLTFLFTDLKGSTELYERVGDLVAFDLVRAHFEALIDIIATEGGAVVKTIGDAVMATFPTPDRAVAAALRMRTAMEELNARHAREDLMLKIGVHEGPCLAVTLNERQDYFGQTVNVASRVQGLANSRAIYATSAVVRHDAVSALLNEAHLAPRAQNAALRGLAEGIQVYEIP